MMQTAKNNCHANELQPLKTDPDLAKVAGVALPAVRASEVKAEQPQFVIFPYLIDHNINIIGGEAGTGKTWLLCGWMAAISKKKPKEISPR